MERAHVVAASDLELLVLPRSGYRLVDRTSCDRLLELYRLRAAWRARRAGQTQQLDSLPSRLGTSALSTLSAVSTNRDHKSRYFSMQKSVKPRYAYGLAQVSGSTKLLACT